MGQLVEARTVQEKSLEFLPDYRDAKEHLRAVEQLEGIAKVNQDKVK